MDTIVVATAALAIATVSAYDSHDCYMYSRCLAEAERKQGTNLATDRAITDKNYCYRYFHDIHCPDKEYNFFDNFDDFMRNERMSNSDEDKKFLQPDKDENRDSYDRGEVECEARRRCITAALDGFSHLQYEKDYKTSKLLNSYYYPNNVNSDGAPIPDDYDTTLRQTHKNCIAAKKVIDCLSIDDQCGDGFFVNYGSLNSGFGGDANAVNARDFNTNAPMQVDFEDVKNMAYIYAKETGLCPLQEEL